MTQAIEMPDWVRDAIFFAVGRSWQRGTVFPDGWDGSTVCVARGRLRGKYLTVRGGAVRRVLARTGSATVGAA